MQHSFLKGTLNLSSFFQLFFWVVGCHFLVLQIVEVDQSLLVLLIVVVVFVQGLLVLLIVVVFVADLLRGK